MANTSKTVQVVADAGMITIRCSDAMISEHPQAFLKSPPLVKPVRQKLVIDR